MATPRSGLNFILVLLTVISAVWTLAAQPAVQTATKSVSGRIIMDSGGPPPRFTLPLQNPGRASATIAVNPQPDGTFRVALPVGLSVVGLLSVAASGYAVKNFTYGVTDLLTSPLVVTPADSELA